MQNVKMPVAFVGHGSPMNALAKNEYSLALAEFQTTLPPPKAIVVVSAHWLTNGTYVTSTVNPKMIYDMYGFPEELYLVKYPALGSPEVAMLIKETLSEYEIKFDNGSWGLDHGTWSILKHIYPKADIPVLQLSIDMTKPPQYHYEMGQQLRQLRHQDILIFGSGNLVHNLRNFSWNENSPAMEWASLFDQWCKNNLDQRNFQPLIHEFNSSAEGKMSVPSLDHYLPLLYILGASEESDKLAYIYEKIQNGSIAMRSFSFS